LWRSRCIRYWHIAHHPQDLQCHPTLLLALDRRQEPEETVTQHTSSMRNLHMFQSHYRRICADKYL
jgi:hypothetical protein